MDLVNRAAFGWGPSAATTASPSQGLVIHYDGSNQGLAAKPHAACIAYWRNTRKFHMGSSRGWSDIGYSFGCCPHGEVFEGRGLNRVQAAQPGGNSSWYSCTLMSGPSEQPTAVQIDAVRQLRAWLMSKGVGGAVQGHRDFFSTSCPGDIAYAMVRDGTFAKPPSSTPSPGRPSEGNDDMPDIISLGAGEDQQVLAGGDTAVRWNVEWLDTSADHPDGGVSIAVDERCWLLCDALVKLRGLPPGGEVDVAWSRYSRDGKTWTDDPWRLTFHADQAGRVEESVGGQFQLDADNQVRLRVINPGSVEVTVEKVTMAKITMFKR